MTWGGPPDDGDPWPPQRPPRDADEQRYDQHAGHPSYPSGEPSAPEPGTWYGRRATASPYATNIAPSRQLYPDAYIDDPDDYELQPPPAYGQRWSPPPGGAHPHQQRRGPGMPTTRQQPRGAGGPTTEQRGPGMPTTRQQPLGPGGPTTGQQPRAFSLDPRATITQQRIRTGPVTGRQPRVPGGPTTGSQPRVTASTPGRRRTRLVIAIVVAIMVLAGVGFVAVLILRDDASARARPRPSYDTTAIASRTVDPAGLTTAEVFGAKQIPSASGGVYQVVKSEADSACGNAATGQLGALLTSLGCSQAVRATMLAADQRYVITAGVLNLPDAASAGKAAGSIEADINAGKGRFAGLGAGGNTDVVTVAQARVAWDTRGHYLVYGVIALANGTPITANDSRVPGIITDVVENYLGDKVLGARAHRSPAPARS